MKKMLAITGIGLALALPRVEAALVAADWTASGSSVSATLGATTVTGANFSNPSSLNFDLSGTEFSSAPLGSSQEVVAYGWNDDWTLSLSSAVEDLLLYPYMWRAGVDYTFSSPFSILSGMTGATVAGNTLTLPGNSFTFYSGVIEFAGSLSTLSLDTTSTNASQIGLTIAYDDTPPAVPLPGTLLLVTAGLAGMVVRRRRGA